MYDDMWVRKVTAKKIESYFLRFTGTDKANKPDSN